MFWMLNGANPAGMPGSVKSPASAPLPSPNVPLKTSIRPPAKFAAYR